MKKFQIGCPVEYVRFDSDERCVVLGVPYPCAPDMGKTLEACERAFGDDTFNRVLVKDSLDEVVVDYRLEGGAWRAGF